MNKKDKLFLKKMKLKNTKERLEILNNDIIKGLEIRKLLLENTTEDKINEFCNLEGFYNGYIDMLSMFKCIGELINFYGAINIINVYHEMKNKKAEYEERIEIFEKILKRYELSEIEEQEINKLIKIEEDYVLRSKIFLLNIDFINENKELLNNGFEKLKNKFS